MGLPENLGFIFADSFLGCNGIGLSSSDIPPFESSEVAKGEFSMKVETPKRWKTNNKNVDLILTR